MPITRLNRRLSTVEALAVVAGILVLGFCGYALTLTASHYWHRRAVEAAIPRYLDELKAQVDQLSKSIERYHAQFGFYPPNHATNGSDRAVINPLYYELVGARWATNYQAYRLPTTKDLVKPEMLLRRFNMNALSNALIFPSSPTNFLDGLDFAGREEDDIILVTSQMSADIGNEFSDDFSTSTWRYTPDPAEHNKGRFDLWVEVNVLDRHYVIGNWGGPGPAVSTSQSSIH